MTALAAIIVALAAAALAVAVVWTDRRRDHRMLENAYRAGSLTAANGWPGLVRTPRPIDPPARGNQRPPPNPGRRSLGRSNGRPGMISTRPKSPIGYRWRPVRLPGSATKWKIWGMNSWFCHWRF